MAKLKDANFFHASDFEYTPSVGWRWGLCFPCMCDGFCASTVDVNGNMLICCVCHSLTCPIYIHKLYFVLNSLEQLVLNILKTTTE